jgi:hypothetical protein
MQKLLHVCMCKLGDSLEHMRLGAFFAQSHA